MSTVTTRTIETHPENCTGCLSCQLACSFTKEKAFNPLKARILVDWTGFSEPKLSFTPDCDTCGVCVRYCAYGALEFKKEASA